jgi:hypothetical protein
MFDPLQRAEIEAMSVFLGLRSLVLRGGEETGKQLVVRARGSVEAGWKIQTSSCLLEGNERVACRHCDR